DGGGGPAGDPAQRNSESDSPPRRPASKQRSGFLQPGSIRYFAASKVHPALHDQRHHQCVYRMAPATAAAPHRSIVDPPPDTTPTISAFTEWRVTFAPRNTGQLLIPPLTLRSQHSKAVTITVTESAKDPVSGKEDVFLETFVDKSTVYVQEQFIITYRLHFNQSVDSLDTGQFNITNARVEELP